MAKMAGQRAFQGAPTLVGMVALCGCSAGDAGGRSVPESELPGQIVAATCDGLRVCCQNLGVGFDYQGCRTAWASLIGTPPDPSAAVYDVHAAAQCVEEYRSIYAACGAGTVEACARTYVGTLPQGAPCTSNEECADPAVGIAVCSSSPKVESCGTMSCVICA